MFYSPLRYPGGKSKLTHIVARVCRENDLHNCFVEAYAGGAAIALYLLMTNQVKKIVLNDSDKAIYAFWHTVLHQPQALCQLIATTGLTLDNWHKAKDLHSNKQQTDLLSLGFATLFLNRTNRSGILQAGLIGGKKQQGKYKMDCRFNKEKIIQRIKRIAQYKNQVALYNEDAVSIIKKFDVPGILFYLDPPYYKKGSSLYEHYYQPEEHQQLSHQLQRQQHASWVLSYDNVKAIRDIYHWVKPTHQQEYELFHRASVKKQGKEILFFSHNLHVPCPLRKHV